MHPGFSDFKSDCIEMETKLLEPHDFILHLIDINIARQLCRARQGTLKERKKKSLSFSFHMALGT